MIKLFTRNVWHYNHGDYDALREELEMMPCNKIENIYIHERAENRKNVFLRLLKTISRIGRLKFIQKTSILSQQT